MQLDKLYWKSFIESKGSNPATLSSMPGFYSLGVNKIAEKIVDGGGVPLLLMPWLSDFEYVSIILDLNLVINLLNL